MFHELKPAYPQCVRDTELLAMTFMISREFMMTNQSVVESASMEEAPRLFQKLWPQWSRLCLIDQFSAESLFRYFEESLSHPGDIAEFGVCHGGTSLLLASALRELGIKKKVYMFDSFSGLPEPNRKYDQFYEAGGMRSEFDQVTQLVEENGLSDYCVIVKGWFKDTVSEIPEQTQFCFVYVDCDLHDSVLDCLSGVYPRVIDGCPIVFDDYNDGSGGVQKAVNDWACKTGETVFVGPSAQATIRKGVSVASSAPSTFVAKGTDGPLLSMEHLNSYAKYLKELSTFLGQSSKDLERFASLASGKVPPDVDLHSSVFTPLCRVFRRPGF
jgi:hypothetical protein